MIDFAVDPETVGPGDDATVTATVENGADRPAETVVRFRTPDGVAHEEQVPLAPGETATVETTVRFPDRGRYEIAVDDRTAIVTVDPDLRAGGAEDEDGTVDGSGGTGDGRDGSGGTNGDPDGDGAVDDYVADLPGFGVAATLVALATIATLARRRTRP